MVGIDSYSILIVKKDMRENCLYFIWRVYLAKYFYNNKAQGFKFL